MFPYLLSIYPILFIFAHNSSEVYYRELWIVLGVMLLICFLTLKALRLLLADKNKAAIAASFGLLITMIYGHPFEYLEIKGYFVPQFRHLQFIPLVLLIWFYLIYILKNTRLNLLPITQLLNILSVTLVSLNVINLGYNALLSNSETSQSETLKIAQDVTPETTLHTDASENLSDQDASIQSDSFPDIYYFIFDEFASVDTAKRIYDFENKDLLDFLTEKNFQTTSSSATRYSSTWYSLYTYFNMEYPDKGLSTKEIYAKILNNDVFKYLKQKNYKIIYNSDQKLNHGNYHNPHADLDYSTLSKSVNVSGSDLSPFRSMLLKTSIFRPYYFKMVEKGLMERENELAKIQITKDAIKGDSPKLVFTHFMITHTPFVFDENGNMVSLAVRNNWKDKKYYLGSYKYGSKVIQELVTEIFTTSDKPFIIVIQSDHGIRGGLGTETKNLNSLPEAAQEWEKIFYTIYLPEDYFQAIPDDFLPINTFPLIFNSVFKENYNLHTE